MTYRPYPFLLLFLLLALSATAACRGETAPDAPTVTQAAAIPAQVTPTAAGLEATATPTAAPLVQVDATSTPAPTPLPAATEEAVPVIEGLLAAPFPENVNPLTGETVADPAVLRRRPIAVKISNYPPVVRPQSGLDEADLVFEHYAEGGVTRFTAVFYDSDTSRVGSVRSGRLLDLEIPKMYDAAFAYSGASGPVRLLIAGSSFFDRVISPDFGHGGFYRVEDPNKAFEHTLFTDTPRLRAILEERGQNRPPEFDGGMVFSAAPPDGGTPAAGVEVRYIGTNIYWQYSPASGEWLRWTDGVAHVDANTSEQLSFKNVVVLAAHHVDSDILEDMVGGGHYSIQIQLWGEGPVTIFRNGERFDGRWRRDRETEMVSFYDGDGNPLPLAIGNSFFQMVPLGFTGLVVE